MKIFVESSAVLAERSGIGQFIKRLIEAYHDEYPSKSIRLFAFRLLYRKFSPPIPPDSTLKYRLLRLFPGKIYTGLFKSGVPLPIDLMIGASKKDIVLFPNFVRWPLAYNKHSVAFVHDLSFVLYGQYSSGPNRDYMLKYVPDTIKKSDHLITISQSSRDDIVKYYHVTPEKISIVHPFIDTNIFNKRSLKEVNNTSNKFSLPEKYILFVSSLEPRKNVVGIMKAYEGLAPSLRRKYGLVLAGGKGWLNEEIHALADDLVSKGLNIVRTGYVADEDLPAMYSGASLFVFPSFYEGFGIPPLEAMACEVPVITSNNSSLPEVVGDAAIQVDAKNTAQITKAMQDVLTQPSLQKKLVAKGQEQIKKFTPKTSAKQLQDAFDRVTSLNT